VCWSSYKQYNYSLTEFFFISFKTVVGIFWVELKGMPIHSKSGNLKCHQVQWKIPIMVQL
jgi:hypothetical protein